MRIYIAGPLNADAVGYLQNVHRMTQASVMLRQMGHAPYNPCLDLLDGIMAGDFGYEDYFYTSQEWLKVADAMFFLGSSPGADKERALAESLGLPIYEGLNEVPNA